MALTAVLTKQNSYDSPKIIPLTELPGPSSSAGQHGRSDTKGLILFDVQVATGCLASEEFVDHGFNIANSSCCRTWQTHLSNQH